MNELTMYYLIGWAVWSIVLMKNMTLTDTIASIIVGSIWFVHAPAMILKRILK